MKNIINKNLILFFNIIFILLYKLNKIKSKLKYILNKFMLNTKNQKIK